ncbi:MAG: metallophosphoesterase [Tannerella sp.]|jgi:predicted MPP superfamily phosphohydrolase|nr:metallophosphoesterase [Tannerella sp.]
MNKSIYMLIVFSCSLATSFLSGCDRDEETVPDAYEANRKFCLEGFAASSAGLLGLRVTQPDKIFTLVHISDAHLSPWSSNNKSGNPSNLTEAVRFANDPEVKVHALVATGDHISNTFSTTRKEALSYMEAFARALYDRNTVPTFASTGNHDANLLNRKHLEYALGRADLFSLVTYRTNYPVRSPVGQNYYYADLADPMGGKIRIVSLDVIDQEGTAYDVQHFATFSQRQIDWFCHTALKEGMTDEHRVIVLVHFPLSTTSPELRAFTSDEYLYSWTMIPEIVEAFRSRNDWKQTYRNRRNAADSLVVDVSFRDAPGDFICYLGGHIHTYLHYEVDGFRNLNPALPRQIMIIANNMSPSEKSKQSPIKRETDGLRNNAFNVYAIDTQRRTVYINFFGATAYYYMDLLHKNQIMALTY